MKPPVTLQISDLDLDTSAIALRIEEHQKREVGVTYGYCACGAAVTRRNAWNARKKGRQPRCKTCGEEARRKKQQETVNERPVMLCAVCRVPLSNKKARQAWWRAKSGGSVTCGSNACKAAKQRDRIDKLASSMTRERRIEISLAGAKARHASDRLIEHEGECMTLSQWATRLGMKSHTLGYRLRSGWTIEAAMTTSVGAGNGGRRAAGKALPRRS